MEDKLKATIDRIIKLSKQNEEFRLEMQRLFGTKVSASSSPNYTPTTQDISEIRAALEIRGNHSINYDFIKEKRLREQLLIDNYRMENAALNLQEKEIDRFYIFCVNAFYQVENIVNYYFHILYPNINDLLTVIEDATKNNGEGGEYRFNRTKVRYENVGDIQIFHKINALCNLLFPNDIPVTATLGNLRKVRNEGEHRCQIIWSEKNEEDKLYVFFKKASFNSIRIVLKKVVSAIKDNIQTNTKTTLSNKSKQKVYINKEEYNATILSLTSKLKEIQKAYDRGDIKECENLIDIGECILASLNVDDDNTKFLQSQFDKWTNTLSNYN